MPAPESTGNNLPAFTPGEVQKASQSVNPDQVFQGKPVGNDADVKPASTEQVEDIPGATKREDTSEGKDLSKVSFDDFQSVLDKHAEKQGEELKDNEKKIDTSHKATEPDIKKQQQSTQQATEQRPGSDKERSPDQRDYSGLPEEVVPLFKKMGRESFDRLKPMYLEHAELKKKIADVEKQARDGRLANKIPDNWYEHEEAYALTPEFRQVSSDINEAASVIRHWQQQISNIRQGKDWEGLAWDTQNKRIVRTAPVAGTPEAEAAIIANLNHAQNQLVQFQNEARQIQQQFRGGYEGARNEVTELTKQFFGNYETEGEKHPMAQVVKNVFDKIPQAYRGHPLAKLVAYTAANNVQLRLILDDMQKKQGATERVTQTAKAAGPNMNDINGVTTGTGRKSDVAYDDFKRIISGYTE
jgi:hypothetical protein